MAGQLIGNCAQEVVHSGRENCSLIPGAIKDLLFTPQNAVYSPDKDKFIEDLPKYLVSSPTVDRITPVGPISGDTPSGGDLITASKGNHGGNRTTGVNDTTVTYQIDNGSPCMYKELSKWNRQTMRVFHVDDAGAIFGTERTVAGKTGFAGYLVTIFVYEVEATGTEPYQLWINLDYSANYENEKKNRHGFVLGAENVPSGLTGVMLVADETAGAKVTTVCGSEDITVLYGDQWNATCFVNKAGENPTAASFDEETGLIVLTPAGDYKVADGEALDAAEISGLEGINTYANVKATA